MIPKTETPKLVHVQQAASLFHFMSLNPCGNLIRAQSSYGIMHVS